MKTISQSLVYGLATTLLCSCFMDQQAPVTKEKTAVGEPALKGIISMQDFGGQKPAAGITAAFYKKSDVKSIRRLFDPMHASTGAAPMTPTCEVVTGKVHTRQAVTFLNVGQIAFAPALSETAIPVEQQSDNSYLHPLSPGFAGGVYSVVVQGSESMKGFKGTISVPETFQDPKAGGVALDVATPKISKKDPFKMEWTASSTPNDANIILVEIAAQLKDQVTMINCRAQESLIPLNGTTVTWQLPADQISQLPETDKAQINLIRGHQIGGKSAEVEVAFVGIRKIRHLATVQN